MQAYGVFAGSVRRQAAVYVGLRRAQAAKSSAITGGERGGSCGLKCAHK